MGGPAGRCGVNAIECEGLRKYYGKSPGIKDVTFSVREGELFGFVGPNGAGKSTTIKLLLNFLFPTAGRAAVMGLDAAKQSKAIKRFTAYVPSDVRLYENMTGAQLLRATQSFYPGADKRAATALWDAFELDASRRFCQLSMGNRKKLSILLALAVNPRVIILDEPTNGLDPMIRKRLFDELRRRAADGMTVLLSSHNLSEVRAYCDRAAFIKRGRIISLTDLRSKADLQKIVTVWSDAPMDFSGLPAELIAQAENKRVYRVGGAPDALARALARAEIDDFTVEAEGLEDRFLSLYEEAEP